MLSGCFLGEKIFFAVTTPVEVWQLLSKPPENITEIVEADMDNVWVRTTSGKLYSCYWITPYDNECWIEIADVPEPSWGEGEIYEGPPYPGDEPIKQSMAIRYYSRFDTAVKYVLLENGNIRKWTMGGFLVLRAPGLMVRYIGSICGFSFIGLFASLALGIVIFRKRVVDNANLFL
jgi:hypothetical protein